MAPLLTAQTPLTAGQVCELNWILGTITVLMAIPEKKTPKVRLRIRFALEKTWSWRREDISVDQVVAWLSRERGCQPRVWSQVTVFPWAFPAHTPTPAITQSLLSAPSVLLGCPHPPAPELILQLGRSRENQGSSLSAVKCTTTPPLGSPGSVWANV